MPLDDSKLWARGGPRDLAGLRASIVRLPDSRPKSGRTPDRHPRENPLSATLCSSLAYLEPDQIPPESVLSRWIPWRLAKKWRKSPSASGRRMIS